MSRHRTPFVWLRCDPTPRRPEGFRSVHTARRTASTLSLWCGLLAMAAVPAQAQQPDSPVTFTAHVAPILFEHCVACHRPGEVAPFSLLTYQDARQRATLIASVTGSRLMPPWKPAAGGPAFLDARVLTDAQLEVLRAWAQSGAVEGDPSALPEVPPAQRGWRLGPPDLVVTMPEPFTLPADGPDIFRTFVMPVPTTAGRYVRALEFQPGNARPVHHANIGIDRSQASLRLDRADPDPGYVGGMATDAWYPPGQMLGWTPGQEPRPAPPGMTWRLEAGSALVVQLHLQPTGKPEPVQVSAGFYFTNDEPTRTPVGLRLGQQTIDIAPGQSGYVVSDDYVLPVDAEAYAVQPHAHNLARHIEGTATLPDGTTRSLISIADWDFRWQNVYRYAAPLVLPKGTTLSMRFTYDNSDANPRNPHRPATRVVWGQNTADEMGDLWVQLVAARSRDHAALNGDVARKIRRQDLDAYTKLQKEEPLNPIRHAAVAMVLLQDGRAQEAIAPFRESIRLGPTVPSTHYNLGVALASAGQLPAALEAFREAVRLDPSYPEAHNNLGALLQSEGRVDEAMGHYRQALAARADNIEARTNLARALKLQDQVAEAVSHYEQALSVREDWLAALFGLAWIRATASDDALWRPEEAVRLATRAAALTDERDPYVLDALAAAYAATGAFGKASSVARAARQIAQAAGLAPLAAAIDTRIALYLRHEVFRERR